MRDASGLNLQCTEPEHEEHHEFLSRRQEHPEDDREWETEDDDVKRDAAA